MGATASSMGMGLLQISAGLEAALGISQSVFVCLIIAIVVSITFILSCVSGIGTGLKKISSACIYLFIFMMVYVFIFGNTQFICKIGAEAIGFMFDNFGTMTTMGNVLADGETWAADWTIQMFAGFLTYAPVVGMFLSRMAKGRTIRCFILVQLLVPSIFCIIWIAIFGGQTIFLQTSGTLDVWNTVQTSGMQATVFTILGSLPLAKIIILLFLVTIILSFSTLADPMSSVAATLSVDDMSAEDEPPVKQKILAGVILGGTAYTLVASGGLNSIKGMFTLVGLLQSIIFIMFIVAMFKMGRQCSEEKNSGCIELPEK